MSNLNAQNFSFVGRAGLGEPNATMAHCMSYFEGNLYLGTTTPEFNIAGDSARILMHDPQGNKWLKVFESPKLDATPEVLEQINDREGLFPAGAPRPEHLPRETGIHSMAVFAGKSDAKPCLYAATLSEWGALVLRSEDGRGFKPVCEPGMGNDEILAFGALTAFNKKLFIATASVVTEEGNDLNEAAEAAIYVSDDPAKGTWKLACDLGFGDAQNQSVFSLATAHGYLYAGTSNPDRGLQLWRTEAKGKAPYKWERVLVDGAHRFNLSVTTAAMHEFNGSLYIGTGIAGLGFDRENDIGPSAAELLRVNKDGSWDLIFGAPRITPDGLKFPYSAMGPGLDDPYNSIIWSMAEHDGNLYIGTMQWEPFDWAMHGKGEPLQGGYQLWASSDGEQWEKVIDAGNGSIASTGLRALQSTPQGLYIGTSVQTKLLKAQANKHSGLADINHPSAGFDVLLGAN
ncbi:MAG: hypothetical protein JKX69_00590 [Rhodobacteraceae bacterium]|nr:hypothetical protein [Paracoccaceae bacterium]